MTGHEARHPVQKEHHRDGELHHADHAEAHVLHELLLPALEQPRGTQNLQQLRQPHQPQQLWQLQGRAVVSASDLKYLEHVPRHRGDDVDPEPEREVIRRTLAEVVHDVVFVVDPRRAEVDDDVDEEVRVDQPLQDEQKSPGSDLSERGGATEAAFHRGCAMAHTCIGNRWAVGPAVAFGPIGC